MRTTARGILSSAIPLLLMISLIPLVPNDYALAALYAFIIIVAAFCFERRPHDLAVFVFGLFIMTASEFLFLLTGVETFTRRSFLGLMPLWLPVLWGWGFVAIKRSLALINL